VTQIKKKSYCVQTYLSYSVLSTVAKVLITLQLIGTIGSPLVSALNIKYSSSLPTPTTKDSTLLAEATTVLNNDAPISSDGSDGDDGYESLRQISGSTDNTFIQRRLFNTSVALTIPLFSFTLPQRATSGSSVDLANQVSYISNKISAW